MSGFGLTQTEIIYRAACDLGQHGEGSVDKGSEGGGANSPWSAGNFIEWDEIGLSPAAGVLSYDLSVFEGLKAQRGQDGGIRLFRVDEHAKRFAASAQTLLLPSFPIDRFCSVIEELVRRNRTAVPASGDGSLYLRPMLFAVEPRLGLGRCRQFSMTVYASPVGDFFSHRPERSLRLEVLDRERAAPGLGTAKCSANYAAVLAVVEASRAKGFNDVVFIDPESGYSNQQIVVTETSGANLFVRLESGHLVTPPLDDQLFPGITRDSVLRVAREVLGITTEERPISLEEIFEAGEEVFCTGTAWSVASIGEIEHRGSAKQFSTSETQTLISSVIRGVQTGRLEDPFGWVREVGEVER